MKYRVRGWKAGVVGCLFLMCMQHLWAEKSYCFRIYLNDKGDSRYRIEEPEAFLSPEAITRRTIQGIPITKGDLPISPAYKDSLALSGGNTVVESRWLQTVVVEMKDSVNVEKLKRFAFVDSIKCVWIGSDRTKPLEDGVDTSHLLVQETPLKEPYGYAEAQIKMLNGIKLHEAGFRGAGVRVAVIDAGFMNVDRISAFDSLKLIGTYNFVSPGSDIFREDDHGTKVLSCLAANIPGVMIGTAPDASYLLLKSEDPRSEFPIEEDYWAAAVEYADSVGVDVITSSLGYFEFDEPTSSYYTQDDLNGRTAFISRAASEAVKRGHLLFCSAGNEGGSKWGKITFPSDAQDLLTVGSVTEEKEKSEFSSVGFTSDYRVKPDVVAMGSMSCVVDQSGNIRYSSGTSFSTPILAGLGVCLIQAFPWIRNKEMILLLQTTSHLHLRPDAELGYGIPDVYRAYKKERKDAVRN